MSTLAIDFDGVLHPYTAGWVGSVPEDEPPCPGAREFLEWCHEQNLTVVVFSSRADHQEGHDGIWDWLVKYQLSPLIVEVTDKKPPAVAYIDDRAVPYAGDWDAVRDGVIRLANGRLSSTHTGRRHEALSVHWTEDSFGAIPPPKD